MGLFDLFKGGDNGDGGDSNPLTALLSALTSSSAKNDKDNAGQENPLAIFFKALISFIKSLFSSDPNTPDYEGPDTGTAAPGTPPETREDIDRRNEREKSGVQKFNDSVLSGLNPLNPDRDPKKSITEFPKTLEELRKRSEDANNGHAVDAIMPVAGDGRISSGFGHRDNDFLATASTEHKGLDIAPAERGDKLNIIAPMPGVVVGAGWIEGYGNTVDILDIYGTRHRFGHLSEIDVKRGDTVEQGNKIAVMGMTGHATGVHLHYEQRDADNVAQPPVINGHKWAQGETFTQAETVAFMHSKGQGTTALASSGGRLEVPAAHGKASIDDQLAKLDLSGHITDGPHGYSPPTSGKGPFTVPPSRSYS